MNEGFVCFLRPLWMLNDRNIVLKEVFIQCMRNTTHNSRTIGLTTNNWQTTNLTEIQYSTPCIVYIILIMTEENSLDSPVQWKSPLPCHPHYQGGLDSPQHQNNDHYQSPRAHLRLDRHLTPRCNHHRIPFLIPFTLLDRMWTPCSVGIGMVLLILKNLNEEFFSLPCKLKSNLIFILIVVSSSRWYREGTWPWTHQNFLFHHGHTTVCLTLSCWKALCLSRLAGTVALIKIPWEWALLFIVNVVVILTATKKISDNC